MGSLVDNDILCGWHLWLHHWFLYLLESVNLDWVSILDQEHLLVVSLDNLTIWKNLRVVVHQENVLLEWITTLKSDHCCLLGWTHCHLGDRCWQKTLVLFLLKLSLLKSAYFDL